ncbi:hypothetical protein Q1695_001070 [Nippostrongylus brasiliensis]|nr:hypothetical protein Q1695_001070 [Nippostrongylus brasiliensis]
MLRRGILRGDYVHHRGLRAAIAMERRSFHLLNTVARGSEFVAFAVSQDSSDWGETMDLTADLMEEIVVQRPSLAQRIRWMIDAPFNILADKINLQIRRHFTQSAAKHFLTTVMARHKAMLKLPDFKRSHQNE